MTGRAVVRSVQLLSKEPAMRTLFVVLTMSMTTAAVAQTAVPTEFPADAMPAANDTLRERSSPTPSMSSASPTAKSWP